MLTQPIQNFQQLTSEARTAGGNDLIKLGFAHDDRRVFEKRARYERAAMLANLLTDGLLWLGRQYGRVAGAIRENMKLRAAEAQLFRMSDRELADIGLTRADIAFAVREVEAPVEGTAPHIDTVHVGEVAAANRNTAAVLFWAGRA